MIRSYRDGGRGLDGDLAVQTRRLSREQLVYWPVFLLPRYLAGVYPRAPGWRVIGIERVPADLDYVECFLDSVAGRVQISVTLEADMFER